MKQKLPNLLRRGKGLLLAFAAATMTISHAQAQDKVKVNNFYYYLNAENKTAELAPTEETTAYATGRLVIPGSINYEGETYSVDVIGDYAFSFCDGITSVSIPSSVKRIGNGAFQGCKKINTVSFMMSTVEEIGDAAFEGCPPRSKSSAIGLLPVARDCEREPFPQVWNIWARMCTCVVQE